MSEANKKQIGGDHYKTEVQHWDFVERHGVGYLEGCATKYVARWRKKGGVEDLRKALHYVEKLREMRRPNRVKFFDIPFTLKFLLANGYGPNAAESRAVLGLLRWHTTTDLDEVCGLLQTLIDEAG